MKNVRNHPVCMVSLRDAVKISSTDGRVVEGGRRGGGGLDVGV
jgi:hypothetical protein